MRYIQSLSILSFVVLVAFAVNSEGKIISEFKPPTRTPSVSNTNLALAISSTRTWAIGHGTTISAAWNDALYTCSLYDINHDTCEVKVTVGRFECLVLSEGSDTLVWEGADNIGIATNEALKSCNKYANDCAIAAIACRDNSLVDDKKMIQRAQTILHSLGFNPGLPDGVAGPVTKKALSDFQHANKILPDGVLDSTTYSWLSYSFRKKYPSSEKRNAIMGYNKEAQVVSSTDQTTAPKLPANP